MIGDSIPIQNQIGGTCYAHAFARSLYRLARIIGEGENPRIFDEVLSWSVRQFGVNGAHPPDVVKAFLKGERGAPQVFPADLLTHLIVRTVILSSQSRACINLRSENIQTEKQTLQFSDELPEILKEAVRNHREPLCWFSLPNNQFKALTDFDYSDSRSITMRDIPPPTGPRDESNISRHAVCLYQVTSGITFKNSWGLSWGDKGTFSVSSLKVFAEVSFLDIVVKESAPSKYASAMQRFKGALEHFPQAVLEVRQEDISYDKSTQLGKGNDEVFLGTFRNKVAAVKVLRPRTLAEYGSLKELTFKFDFKNIVETYGYKKSAHLVGDIIYLDVQIAMSFEQLGNLSKHFETKKEVSPLLGGRLGWKNFFNILLDIAEALDYLLRLHFVHGDLCSDNIVLSGTADNLVAKLTDFGTLSYTGTYNPANIGAHYWWISPEVKLCMEQPNAIVGQVVTHKTDIFGIGKLIQFLLPPTSRSVEKKVSGNSFASSLRSKYELTIFDVSRDGNCFFHAVERQLGVLGIVENYVDLRKKAVDHVSANKSIFAGFQENSSIDEYIARMSKNGTWADNLIIRALSKALNLNITIIQDTHIDSPIEFNVPHSTTTVTIGHLAELHYVSLERLGSAANEAKKEEMANFLSQFMETCLMEDFNKRPSADSVLDMLHKILREHSFAPQFQLLSPRDQLQCVSGGDKAIPVVPVPQNEETMLCDTIERLFDKVKGIVDGKTPTNTKFPMFSSTFKFNFYRNSSWKSGEIAKVNQLKAVLIADFGLSESGFNYELSLDSMNQVCEFILNIIRAPPIPPSSNINDDNSYDILQREALKNVAISHFTEKVLVDNEPSLLPEANGVTKKYAECSPDKREQLLVDILRHRLALPNWSDLPTIIEQSATESEAEEFDFDADVIEIEDNHPVYSSSVDLLLVDDFTRVLKSSDSISQEYFMSSVLNRRLAVPLLLNVTRSGAAYQSIIPALYLTRTLVCNGKLACIAYDTSMMRVAIISDQNLDSINRQSSRLMEKGLGCHSLSKGKLKNPLIEVGFGFLERGKEHDPVIVLHLAGVHDEAVKNVLYGLVDVVIVEFGSDLTEAAFKKPVLPAVTHPSPLHFIHWNSSCNWQYSRSGGKKEGLSLTLISGNVNDDQFLGNLLSTLQKAAMDRSALPSKLNKEEYLGPSRLSCQIHEPLTKFVLEIESNGINSNLQYSNQVLQQVLNQRFQIDDLLQKSLLRGVRDTFVLQKSFCEQVHEERAAVKCIYRDAERTKHRTKAASLQADRSNLVKRSSYRLPKLIQGFVALVSEENSNKRVSNFAFFEQLLSEKCVEAGIASASEVVSPEHIWREIANAYSADPTNKSFAKFPHLAALHLLDGFTLEMTDGECSQVNEVWLEAVTTSLNQMIEEKRSKSYPKNGVKLFVLSILGTQKSGKSTLLNIMFGCRLRTGINRCTRGINIQLIRSSRPEYDYVMVLDVEGVRSPELKDDPERNNHDNRLGLFAIWSADATLVLINSTQLNDVVDILSLVKYLTEKSSLLDKGSKVCSRLFFAMNRLNIGADAVELKESRDTLMHNIDSVFQNNPGASSEMLRGFDRDKDIFLWGNLKMADKPPNDLPSPEYGASVRVARSRIHEYFKTAAEEKSWMPQGLATWMGLVKRVRGEILDLETRIHMIDAKEVECREAVGEFMARCRQTVSKEYSRLHSHFVETFVSELEEYKKSIEKRPKSIAAQQDPSLETVQFFSQKINNNAEKIVNEQRERFHRHFEEHDRHQRFKEEFERKWEDFLESELKSSNHRVREIVLARAYHNDKLTDAKKTINERVLALCKENDSTARQKWTERQKEEKFKEIYSTVKREVEKSNPQISEFVKRDITDTYESSGVEISNGKDYNNEEINSSEPDKDGSLLAAIWRQLSSPFNRNEKLIPKKSKTTAMSAGGNTKDMMDLQRFLSKHMSDVEALLESAQMYSDALVVEVIQKTKSALHKNHFNFKLEAHVHATIKSKISETLLRKQLEWETTNSVVSRLEASRGSLYRFFLDAVEGANAIEIVVNSIKECFKENLTSAISDHLVSIVLKRIRDNEPAPGANGKEVVLNSKVFQAEADFHLLENLENHDRLASWLKNSTGHYRTVAKLILRRYLEKELKDADNWATARGKIVTALNNAVEKAGEVVITRNDETDPPSKVANEITGNKTSEGSRASVLFGELKKALQWLPKIADNLYNVTEDLDNRTTSGAPMLGLNHQSVDSIKGIAATVIASLPGCTTEQMPVAPMPPNRKRTSHAEKQHDDILEELVNRLQLSQEPTFRARCDKCCPMCGIQCTHPDGFNHQGLHRSSHQPQGIIGVNIIGTNVLCAESCVGSAKSNDNIVFNFGKESEKSVPYRSFQSHFEDWENPPYEGETVPEPLQVRELIFATKQKLLVSLHSTTEHEVKENTSIPSEYHHDKNQLRERLNFIRGNF